ncbi:flagellin [Sphingomonas sp.]|jgi:flagellar hook-associated protein 3 FlgL|uniref:flagellin N-terminal helical domain-containing protein n=1 Tax=Sphingomonas sp. TaxID=28214 RepID=UPI002ED86257
MIRVATIPLQRTLSNSIQKAQKKLGETQIQLDSGKRVSDLAGLGSKAVRTLSTRSLLARQEAQVSAANQLGTTLSLYDANITAIDNNAAELREKLVSALGTGQTPGMQGAIEGAFDLFRGAINGRDGEAPMFAGAQTDTPPFNLLTLNDAIGATPATAFANDGVRAAARVGDGVDVVYGVTANELGSGLLSAFRTLAEAGPYGATPTVAQTDAMRAAIAQIDTALPQVRAINAENGRKQEQVERLAVRGEDRAVLLKDVISRNEDADWGQISIDLAQQKTVLQASYSVFSQLSGLSLVNFLR